ncbi:MAG: M56 family metallopeptidase [Terriglobales bacterium]
MIFAARGFLVSLAFFAVVYCTLSSLVVFIAWSMNRLGSGQTSAISANFLFGLRIFSFVVSSAVALFFAFPSFWLMEKATLDEDAGTFVLAACSLLILCAGLVRALRAQAKTSLAVRRWLSRTASTGDNDAARPTLSAGNGAPALILVGIQKPQVMISDMAAQVLSAEELQAAVRHEIGHMRSWDNLKKVLISATPFPGMACLEGAWREAAELAADDAAVMNRRDALDLAGALIKISRYSKQWSEPELASGLVSGSSSISLRVKRLLEWRSPGRLQRACLRYYRLWPLLVLAAVIVGVGSDYGATLALTHRLTEILVP